jgi:hypothetical protein
MRLFILRGILLEILFFLIRNCNKSWENMKLNSLFKEFAFSEAFSGALGMDGCDGGIKAQFHANGNLMRSQGESNEISGKKG